ncbi:MAG: PspC domain-containing protein [Phycisphaeraceae bacterium]
MAPLDPARPLQRSSRNIMIGGVCAGIAAWLGWDVTLVRVLYAIVTAITGFVPGIVAYVALWIIMPMEPAEPME